jgi:hypothetical protein
MSIANNWTMGLDKIINLANEAKDLDLSGDDEGMVSPRSKRAQQRVSWNMVSDEDSKA